MICECQGGQCNCLGLDDLKALDVLDGRLTKMIGRLDGVFAKLRKLRDTPAFTQRLAGLGAPQRFTSPMIRKDLNGHRHFEGNAPYQVELTGPGGSCVMGFRDPRELDALRASIAADAEADDVIVGPVRRMFGF
jgi:hypothetical protein